MLLYTGTVLLVSFLATAHSLTADFKPVEDSRGIRSLNGTIDTTSLSRDETAIGLDLVIVDSASHNVSHDFDVLFHQHTASPSKLHGRGVSKPIKDCPANHSFLYSRCSRNHSPQAWSLVCRAANARVPPGKGITWGACASNELCIDGRTWFDIHEEGYRASVAYCVEQQNFVPLAQLLAGLETSGSVQTGFSAAAGVQSSVAALLTTSDSLTLIKAQKMEIQAQKADSVSNVPLWRTLDAGDQQCNDCSSVGLLEVPAGTERIKVHVELAAPARSGLLYLASAGGLASAP